MIFGVKDTHVPDAGRDLIRAKLREAGVVFSFHEFTTAAHAFIRDELSKGRYDPAVTKICFEVLLEPVWPRAQNRPGSQGRRRRPRRARVLSQTWSPHQRSGWERTHAP